MKNLSVLTIDLGFLNIYSEVELMVKERELGYSQNLLTDN